jgi:hypothetical protein
MLIRQRRSRIAQKLNVGFAGRNTYPLAVDRSERVKRSLVCTSSLTNSWGAYPPGSATLDVLLCASVAVHRLEGRLDLAEDAQFLCHIQALRRRNVLGTELQERDQHAALIP